MHLLGHCAQSLAASIFQSLSAHHRHLTVQVVPPLNGFQDPQRTSYPFFPSFLSLQVRGLSMLMAKLLLFLRSEGRISSSFFMLLLHKPVSNLLCS